MRDVFVRLVREDYTESLHRVDCPVELVWGDHDTEVPLVVAHRIQAALPSGGRLVVCEDTGHMTPTSVPAELRAAVERLLP